jgi:hypothetical protein
MLFCHVSLLKKQHRVRRAPPSHPRGTYTVWSPLTRTARIQVHIQTLLNITRLSHNKQQPRARPRATVAHRNSGTLDVTAHDRGHVRSSAHDKGTEKMKEVHTRLQGVGFPKPTPLVSENQRQETNSPSENKETGDRRSHYFYRENQPLSAENQPQAAAPRRPSAAPTPAVPGVLELNKGVAHPSRSDCRFWLAGCHAVQRSQKQRAICKGGG